MTEKEPMRKLQSSSVRALAADRPLVSGSAQAIKLKVAGN